MLKTVEDPDYVIKGYEGVLVALQEINGGMFLAVVYKELSEEDGFIITAYFTSKTKLEKEAIAWLKR